MKQSKALKNFKEQCKRRQANLLDPNWRQHEDLFAAPLWFPGMATAEYLRRFQNLCHTKPVVFFFADRAAPCLNPLEPEVVEEGVDL